MGESYRVAVVGGTGQVGSLMLQLLAERGFPAREIVPFASAASAGRRLLWPAEEDPQARELVVESLSEESIRGFDIALFSAGSGTSGEWAPRFAEAGAVVIDNSSRWRMHEEVPLVVSEVNPEALEGHRGIVANPNCSTMQMVVALKPIHDAAGIERLVVSTYQAVSGTGRAAVEELLLQAQTMLQGQEPPQPQTYPHEIAFNVLPQAGSFVAGTEDTDEERKLIDETRKILGDEEIRVSATCARVPVVIGHSESVNVQTRRPLSVEETRELLLAAPGLRLVDDPASSSYPMPSEAAGRDEVLVGRLRRDSGHERALNLWIVADNLRKGAATNAVQLAEIMHERGLVRAAAAPIPA